jgi:hypothetical protein
MKTTNGRMEVNGGATESVAGQLTLFSVVAFSFYHTTPLHPLITFISSSRPQWSTDNRQRTWDMGLASALTYKSVLAWSLHSTRLHFMHLPRFCFIIPSPLILSFLCLLCLFATQTLKPCPIYKYKGSKRGIQVSLHTVVWCNSE